MVQKELEEQRQVVDYGVGSLGSFQPPPMAQNCKFMSCFILTFLYYLLYFFIAGIFNTFCIQPFLDRYYTPLKYSQTRVHDAQVQSIII